MCVIARYTNTPWRASRSWRASRIAAAGTSVISSQKPRKVLTSRAHTNPTSANRKAPVASASERPCQSACRASRANSAAGAPTTATRSRKKPLSGSTPNAGRTSPRNPAPTACPEASTHTPAAPSNTAPTDWTASPARGERLTTELTAPARTADAPARTSAAGALIERSPVRQRRQVRASEDPADARQCRRSNKRAARGHASGRLGCQLTNRAGHDPTKI